MRPIYPGEPLNRKYAEYARLETLPYITVSACIADFG
jgi:hypothetical protein